MVLDTNILLSHLEYVKKIISHGLGGATHFTTVELKDQFLYKK